MTQFVLDDPVLEDARRNLEQVVDQFPRAEMAWVELVQNHRDSETPQIDWWYFLDEQKPDAERDSRLAGLGMLDEFKANCGNSLFTVMIVSEDYGIGMTHEDRDSRFFNMYFSAKEFDVTKAGKFGIGGKSVFKLLPDVYAIESTKDAEWWQARFTNVTGREDQFNQQIFSIKSLNYVYDLITDPALSKTKPKDRGTREIFVRHFDAQHHAVDFISRMMSEVTSRAHHIEIPMYINKMTINRPFDIEDAVAKIKFSSGDLKGVIALRKQRNNERAVADYQIEEHGISIEQGRNLTNDSWSVLLESPRFKHTIDRTQAMRDSYFEHALAIVRAQEPLLVKQIYRRLEEITTMNVQQLRQRHSTDYDFYKEIGELSQEYSILLETLSNHLKKLKLKAVAQSEHARSFLPLRECTATVYEENYDIQVGKLTQKGSFQIVRKKKVWQFLPADCLQRRIFQTTQGECLSITDVLRLAKENKVVYVAASHNDLTSALQKAGKTIIRTKLYDSASTFPEEFLSQIVTVKKVEEQYRFMSKVTAQNLSAEEKRFCDLIRGAIREYDLGKKIVEVMAEKVLNETKDFPFSFLQAGYGSSGGQNLISMSEFGLSGKTEVYVNLNSPTVRRLMAIAEKYDYAKKPCFAAYFAISLLYTEGVSRYYLSGNPHRFQKRFFKKFMELENARQ
ncbi:hypothetical protein HY486_02495 [Candidatus Woesearchaeota archaeon]|nr:hypothetical protein [Candidatus Woesearchaeota archaeon]